jgi:ferredoxin-NADP reductase
MIKYLIDKNEKRDVVLVYADKGLKEFVYKDIFSEAIKRIGLRVIYFESDKKGHMTADLIKSEVKDYKSRMFYLSGPHAMVSTFQEELGALGISKFNIKVDYFPGY